MQVGNTAALAGLCHPVATFQVQFLQRVNPIGRRGNAQVDHNVTLGANHCLLCLPLALPATGGAGQQLELVAPQMLQLLGQRMAQGGV